MRDTYYNWQQEAALYRERMERTSVNVNLTLNNNLPTETPDNPLDDEKKRAEIAQIHSEAEKNKAEVAQIQTEEDKNKAEIAQIRSETEKNKAETDKIHLIRTAFVVLFILIACLTVLTAVFWQFLPQDVRYERMGKLVELLIDFRGG